jgi:adenylate kinase family enzyme
MTAVLVTGMSGAGKSTALAELARRGHRVVDTDYGDWSEDVQPAGEAGSEQLWREDRMDALLAEPAGGTLFISGCVANQVKFYPRFHAIVLLSAPTDVILDRVASRRTNDYGKTHAERALILHHIRTIEPLLRVGATAEIDTRRPVDEVADLLESIAGVSGSRSQSFSAARGGAWRPAESGAQLPARSKMAAITPLRGSSQPSPRRASRRPSCARAPMGRGQAPVEAGEAPFAAGRPRDAAPMARCSGSCGRDCEDRRPA